jgi:type I restriction enzyme, S subunit
MNTRISIYIEYLSLRAPPPLDEQQRIVAYLDSVQARLASLRQLQSAAGEELSALLPSVLDRAFKGEL